MDTTYWIFPSNPSKFDAMVEFKKNNVTDWEKNCNAKDDDIVFLCITEPTQALAIQTRVQKVDDKIWLELIKFIKPQIPLKDLQQYAGINANIQGPQEIKEQKHIDFILNYPQSLIPFIPLNQILYGPPGTGKTYATITKALEILKSYGEINEIPEDRKEQKEQFDAFKARGQIGFVTFHQSYGYEEFIEGIKPNVDFENSSNNMEYIIKDGIFKEMCKEAFNNYQNSLKTKQEIKQEIGIDELLEEYACFIEKQLNEGETPKYKSDSLKTNMKIKQVCRLQNGDFRSIRIGTTDSTDSMQSLTRDIIVRDYENFKNGEIKEWRDIKPTTTSQSSKHGNAMYYFILYSEIKEFEEKHYKKPTESIPIDNTLKPYILIIDEINRGNISKILGELITLIEPSKRIGESEALEVQLPYSQESFGVPKNLYIIGTMNTADRSIALLDTALRRRFNFIEMMPDYRELQQNCEGIDLQKLLEIMNNRIEFLLDREHIIGHAFLINAKNIDDLQSIFKNKIIPLLQEYFYDDYAKIDAVLNHNGMIESKSMNEVGINLSEEFVDSEKKVYKITEVSTWGVKNFVKIYDNNIKIESSTQDKNE